MASSGAEWKQLLAQYQEVTKLIRTAYMTPVGTVVGDYTSAEYIELAERIVALKSVQRDVKARLDVALAA
jgi:hypothetical protein